MFLAHTITSKICSAIPDPSKPDLVYQTLRDIALPLGMANAFGTKSLFHAISPKERYLVCYLPQYTTQAKAVLTQLSNSLLKHFVAPVSMAPLGISTPPPPPPPMAHTPPPHQLVELDTWIDLQFCMPFCLDTLSSPHPSGDGILQLPCDTLSKPSYHNILQWLAALWKLFQNTAWDRWWYQNGITYYWQEPCYLLLALTSPQSPPSHNSKFKLQLVIQQLCENQVTPNNVKPLWDSV